MDNISQTKACCVSYLEIVQSCQVRTIHCIICNSDWHEPCGTNLQKSGVDRMVHKPMCPACAKDIKSPGDVTNITNTHEESEEIDDSDRDQLWFSSSYQETQPSPPLSGSSKIRYNMRRKQKKEELQDARNRLTTPSEVNDNFISSSTMTASNKTDK